MKCVKLLLDLWGIKIYSYDNAGKVVFLRCINERL